VLAVIIDVGLSPQNVCDLFFRTRRDIFIDLELGDARLVGRRNVLVWGVVVSG
jgi:hypothetical protein